MVASALATKIAHEIDPENMVGCMLAGGIFYPYSCRPEDYFKGIEKDRDGFFFIDVQAKRISFDLVIDFDVEDRNELIVQIKKKVEKEVPEYIIHITLDNDTSD